MGGFKDYLFRERLTEAAHQPLSRPEALERIKAINQRTNALAVKGGLTREEGEEYDSLNREFANHRFDHAKPPSMEKAIADSGHLSTLTPEITHTARTDALKHRDIFVELHAAAAGVRHGAHTGIDKIVLGEHPTVTPEQMHSTFEATRQSLHKTFGPTLTLWRSPTKQMNKPTQNWATTKEAALQYGPKVISAKIPTDDVVAVNTGHLGKYHEVVVKTPKGGR